MDRLQIIKEAVEKASHSNTLKMDWLGMEHCLRNILREYHLTDMDAVKALSLIDEAIGAFTKRGYELE